jgi:hypothetical protein
MRAQENNKYNRQTSMAHQVHTYTELRRQIHDDLRIQHPEWVQPNGESPMCDFYEARLMDLLNTLTRNGLHVIRFALLPHVRKKHLPNNCVTKM